MNLRGLVFVQIVGLAGILATGSNLAYGQVTSERLLEAGQEPRNWLTYSGGYDSQRHTTLTGITPANVVDLQLEWVYQVRSRAGAAEKFEATPLVVDGVMYTVTPPNDLVALDALTGRAFWIYSHTPSQDARVCCGRINRGVAIHGDTLFMGTIDAHLLAIDARNGRLKWDVEVADPALGVRADPRPADRQRQGRHRSGRRRIRHSRLHCGLRRRDR